MPAALRPDLIQSARDTLFTSGSLGRYSKMLNSVLEAPGALYSGESEDTAPRLLEAVAGLPSMNFFIITLIKAAVVAFVLMTTLAYLQWIERKVIAHVQIRVGPYRVGPHGLLQPLADVIKLLTKEDLLPSHVNRFFYFLAPFVAVTLALISISVIPFGGEIKFGPIDTMMQLTDLKIGVLFVLGISSVGVYGVALAGWASNNKYALLGGLRSSAQMISYELPLALAVTGPLLLSNTLSFRALVDKQGGFMLGFLPNWHIFQGPFPQIFAFFIFMIAGFAETNRVPFDLPEAENELVAGFHTEYSSMKFASFFMAEYANMVTVCSVATLLFLGGLAAAVSGSRVEFRPVPVVSGKRVDRDFSWPEPGAPQRPLYVAGGRRRVSGNRRGSSDSDPPDGSDAAVLVFRKGRIPVVRLYLDPSHAATLSLRSVDAVGVDVPVSHCHGEPAHHRLFGRTDLEIIMEAILFFAFAGFAVASAISLVLQTHPISSALALIGVMVSLAVLYFLLGAEFIAAAQLIVYAGAIMVLFVFVIMLLNAGAEGPTVHGWRTNVIGIPLLAVFVGLTAATIQRFLPPTENVVFGGFASGGAANLAGGPAGAIGAALFTKYLLPFEATSVLILIALVGAIVLARKEI